MQRVYKELQVLPVLLDMMEQQVLPVLPVLLDMMERLVLQVPLVNLVVRVLLVYKEQRVLQGQLVI